MGQKKMDLRIVTETEKETCRGNISIRVPKWLEIAYYKIPAGPRNKLIRKLLEAFVDENKG